MTTDLSLLLNVTRNVVCAYVSRNQIPKSQLPDLIASVYSSIGLLRAPVGGAAVMPKSEKSAGPRTPKKTPKKPQLRILDDHFT